MICAICLDEIINPMKLLCNHEFCKTCICNSLVKCKNQCPLCRAHPSIKNCEDALRLIRGDIRADQWLKLKGY